MLAIPIFRFWFWEGGQGNFRAALLCAVAVLPLSAAVNTVIKIPLIVWLKSELGIGDIQPVWFVMFIVAVAPITEETIKVYCLVIPKIRRLVRDDRSRAFLLGAAMGFGFGVGEAFYLAYSFTRSMQGLAGGSLLEIIAFFGERLLAIFAHACFTAVAVLGLSRGAFLKYLLIAAGLHYAINVGPGLYLGGVISPYIAAVLIAAIFAMIVSYTVRIQNSLRTVDEPADDGNLLYRRQ